MNTRRLRRPQGTLFVYTVAALGGLAGPRSGLVFVVLSKNNRSEKVFVALTVINGLF